MHMSLLARRLLRETEGQDLIEYVLLAATISIVVVASMVLVKNALDSRYTAISSGVAS